MILGQQSRGTDATGVAWISKPNEFGVLKRALSPSMYNNQHYAKLMTVKSHIAIAHNRAATCNLAEKGMDKECHPFMSEDGTFMLLQNGVVPNYDVLHNFFVATGHKFSSGIDSELLLHVLEEILRTSKDRTEAFAKFRAMAVGNVLVLFSDGELWGYAGTSSFNVIFSESNIYIASEFRALIDGLKKHELLTDKSQILTTDGKACIRIIDEKEQITYKLIGEWKKDVLKDGDFVFNKRCVCDFCGKSDTACESFPINNFSRDRCFECYKAGATKLKWDRDRENSQNAVNRHPRVVHVNAVNDDDAKIKPQTSMAMCSRCKLPMYMSEVLFCGTCRRYFCAYCLNDHDCTKSYNKEPSQFMAWLIDINNKRAKWEG